MPALALAPSEPAAPPVATPADGTPLAPASHGRASWSGLLKLHLVLVPVKAYTAAVSGQDLHFHQLHAGCGQRVRYEKRCPLHGPIDAGGIASGYAYAPDQHVVIDETELDKLRPAQDKALTLERFLDVGQLDPALYAGRTWYLLPDGPAAHHPYAVLAQAMHERGQCAVGRVVLSGRRQLVLVRPVGAVLALHQLHYPTQVRAGVVLAGDVHGGLVSDAERQLAGQLMEAASQPIPWSEYRDDTKDKVLALVEATLQGRTLEAPVAEETPVLRLLDALQQSVAQALGQAATPARAVATTKKRKKNLARRSA
jgi:DNA end-binding protein Ku